MTCARESRCWRGLRRTRSGRWISARCGGVRTGDPGAERGGCLHAGVFGLGSGYELCQPESDASAGCDCGRAGPTASDPLRQRAGVDEPAFSGVVRGTADRVGAHPARQADAERPHGELSRTVAGRVFDGELVSEPVRCAAEDRSVAEGVQRRTSAQQLGIQTPKEFAAAQAAGFYRAERGARDSNAVPCPSRSPIPAQTGKGAAAETCRILT